MKKTGDLVQKVVRLISKQMTGIEPASPAWEAGVLPMNYICLRCFNEVYYTSYLPDCKAENQVNTVKLSLLRYLSYCNGFFRFMEKMGSNGVKSGVKNGVRL